MAAGASRIAHGCVQNTGSVLSAGSADWTSSCTGDCDNTVNSDTSTVYTVTFSSAFANAPVVMVTALTPLPFTDGISYPNVPVVVSRSTTAFSVRLTNPGGSYLISYPNAFCFQALL
ncbi:MAG: hypothetical protein ABS96_16285 [Lysobacteraceae bacterium SCN 69-123]|nr:MAG: hypothetical protein ABS96_16285 [Xanthomonadaceae bacterium SCN 69-123]